ncbi:sensor histidine kinase [Winogradskyella sp.]|uniref:sensor histidine kinase n=1 Tax=Winogradskyella sp. TaxID=1883156 RepID=UPI00261E0CED|nr:histidine kinase [Winogradskyella sp.]
MASNAKINKRHITISLYWKVQLTVWSLGSIYWAYVVYTRDNYSVFYTLLSYVIDVFIGIFLTHMYRTFIARSNKSNIELKKLLLRIIPSIIILAIFFMFFANLKWYYYWAVLQDKNLDLLTQLFYWDPVLITGLRSMSIWVLAYHLYHYYISQIAITKVNAQLSIIAKQAQLDNLSAQLNPHFLFNSLNSIKSLVIENPSIARRAIDLLSDLLRLSLYKKDNDLNTIEQELALVRDYIELEKLRFEERLQLNVAVKDALRSIEIPALSIQLLVENAIKHGIDLRISGGVVILTIKELGNTIIIKVENPGTLKANKSSGLGLKNLKKRLEIQYKGKANFSLKESGKERVLAEITIPKTIENETI